VRVVDFPQYVRPAEPAATTEGALRDHVGALLHRRQGRSDNTILAASLVEVDDLQTLSRQRLQIAGLVLKTQFLDDAEVGSAPFRGLDFAQGDTEFQGGQMAAGQWLLTSVAARRSSPERSFMERFLVALGRVPPGLRV